MTSVIDKENSSVQNITIVRNDTVTFNAPQDVPWTALIILYPYNTGGSYPVTFFSANKSGSDIYIANNLVGTKPTAISQTGNTVSITLESSSSWRGQVIVYY